VRVWSLDVVKGAELGRVVANARRQVGSGPGQGLARQRSIRFPHGGPECERCDHADQGVLDENGHCHRGRAAVLGNIVRREPLPAGEFKFGLKLTQTRVRGVGAPRLLGERQEDPTLRRGLAPAIGLAGLVTATVLVVRNFAVLTGTTSAVVTALPWLIAVAALAGLGYAWWLRRHRPTIYAGLAQDPTASIHESTA
jgi:hypothetical protein